MSTEKLSELSKPVAYSLRFRNMNGEPDKTINANTTFSTLEKAKAYGLGSRYVTQDDGKIVSVRDPSQDPIVEPLYSQEYVSALDKVAQFWIGESAGWKKRAEDAEKRIAELEGQLQSGFTPEALAQEERAENAEQRVAELEAKTAMTMGVGSGNGNLFVHGDYDSIKAAQAIVLENESLRAKLATPVRLQSPWVDKAGNRWLLEGTTADVIRAAGFAVTVEGDE
ncbi:hypothetical protein PTR67_10180 [Serratia nevei]|uniref:hypothetical protein n=1 Tax=Serratia nevei TaxID=2703794 RepID=UPI00313CA781